MNRINSRELEPQPFVKSRRVFIMVVIGVYAIPAVIFTLNALTAFDTSLAWKYFSVAVAGSSFFCLAMWGLRKERIPLKAIGLTLSGIREAVLLTVGGWAIVVLVNIFGKIIDHGNVAELLDKSVLYVLLYWIFVGVAEEILFRGYILTRLMKTWAARNNVLGKTLAVVVASFLFATAHIPQRVYQVASGDMTLAEVFGSVVLLSIVGIAFSYLFLRTKSIILVGLIHGAVIVPLVGFGEDAFLPVIILATLYIELFLFLRRIRSRRDLRSTLIS